MKCSVDLANILKNGLEQEKIDKEVEKYLIEKFEVDKYVKNQENEVVEEKNITRLEIVVSTVCNLNCIYCYASGGSYGMPEKIMSYQTADAIIDYICLKNLSIKEIMFFGGEPLLGYKTIMYICERLQTTLLEQPVYTMVSNLTFLPEEFISYIKRYQIGITVSIDGPKEINDCLRIARNGESTYDAIMCNLKTLQQHGLNPRCIECTYTPKHEEMGYTKETLYKFFEENFGDSTLILCNEEKYEQELKKNPSLYLEKTENINDMMHTVLMDKWYYKSTTKHFCNAGFNKVEIFPNGQIYPCHGFEIRENWNMGNIYDIEWEKGEKCIKIRKRLLNIKDESNCAYCTARDSCGHCVAELFMQWNGDIEPICQWKRKCNEKELINFCKQR